MNIRGGVFSLLSVAAISVFGAEYSWNAGNQFAGWKNPVRCSMERADGVLRLDVTAADSSIALYGLAIDPVRYDRLEIVYRAKGFPKSTSGQLFFADRTQKSWSGSQFFRFSDLKSDWQWHTLVLKVNQKMVNGGPDSWLKRDVIDKIRLDLVDQFPGLIEIRSMAWKEAGKASPQVWNAANQFVGWSKPVRCRMDRTAGGLKLTVTGKDSFISHSGLEIDPKLYDGLEIVYKATGLPKTTSGQVFFADRKQKSWSGSQYFRFFNLKSDGQWHTLSLKVSDRDLAFGKDSWLKRDVIDKIRLDLVDQPTGTIMIRSITWKPVETVSVVPSAPGSGNAAGAPVVWNAANQFADWTNPVRCLMENEVEGLKITVTGRDSCISHFGLKIDSKVYDELEIVYKATGLPAQTSGQVFFADRKQRSWSGRQYFQFANLKSDGRWHTLSLKVNNCDLALGTDSWLKRDVIDKIRLDLVDQPTGIITVRSITWKSSRRASAPAASGAVSAVAPVVWNASNQFAGWGRPVRCKMEKQGEVLRLTVTGADSFISIVKANIDPKVYNRLDIVYKATGIPKWTTGQVFFADRTQKSWSGRQNFQFARLQGDGQWHTLTLRLNDRDLAFGKDSWLKRDIINKLRLDIMDQMPGVVDIKSITFSSESSAL